MSCCPTGIVISGEASGGLCIPDSDPFKLNYAATTTRKRSRTRVLQLSKAKPCVISVYQDMLVISSNVNIPASGFHFRSLDQYLEIINLDPFTGCLVAADTSVPAIPIPLITMQDLEDLFLTTFYQQPNPNQQNPNAPLSGTGYY